jgi:ribosomal protein S25
MRDHVKLSEQDWIVTDFLDEKRKEITARLKELKPLVEEYQRLEAAASALDGVGGSAAVASTPTAAPAARKAPGRRGPGRPKGSKTRTAKAASASAPAAATATAAAPAKRGGARRKAGRRKGSGTRAAQALSFVQAQPGITIPELAARMGIKQNYLYRVLPSLEEEGKVAKQGRGWHPKGS